MSKSELKAEPAPNIKLNDEPEYLPIQLLDAGNADLSEEDVEDIISEFEEMQD